MQAELLFVFCCSSRFALRQQSALNPQGWQSSKRKIRKNLSFGIINFQGKNVYSGDFTLKFLCFKRTNLIYFKKLSPTPKTPILKGRRNDFKISIAWNTGFYWFHSWNIKVFTSILILNWSNTIEIVPGRHSILYKIPNLH